MPPFLKGEERGQGESAMCRIMTLSFRVALPFKASAVASLLFPELICGHSRQGNSTTSWEFGGLLSQNVLEAKPCEAPHSPLC